MRPGVAGKAWVGGGTLTGLECCAHEFDFIWSGIGHCWQVKEVQMIPYMRKLVE